MAINLDIPFLRNLNIRVNNSLGRRSNISMVK
jgi:hypothetical protein